MLVLFFFFNVTAPTEIYTYLHTLSLHAALPISGRRRRAGCRNRWSAPAVRRSRRSRDGAAVRARSGASLRVSRGFACGNSSTAPRLMLFGSTFARYSRFLATTFWASRPKGDGRSEEHTSELQSLMRVSYAVFTLKKKRQQSSIKATIAAKENTNDTEHTTNPPPH